MTGLKHVLSAALVWLGASVMLAPPAQAQVQDLPVIGGGSSDQQDGRTNAGSGGSEGEESGKNGGESAGENGAGSSGPQPPRALDLGDYNRSWFAIDALNEGLIPPARPMNRATPQATMEGFVQAARNREFDRAAQALNLNLVPRIEQPERAGLLANQLYNVLDRKISLDWASLPDRPDGVSEDASGDNPLAGQPRRSIRFGLLELGERDIELLLTRVRVGDASPVWVVSAQTVENVPALFTAYAPSQYERALPDWMRTESPVGPRWFELLALPVIVLLGLAAGWAVFRLLDVSARPFNEENWARAVLMSIRAPAALFAALSVIWFLIGNVLVFSQSVEGWLNPLLAFGFLASVIWLVARAVSGAANFVSQRYVDDIDDEYNDDARRLYTNISIARRLVILLLAIIGAGIVFSQLQAFRLFGMTLLGSAGVLTLVLGFAAREALANIMASVQVAFAKPVRIGDAVFYEDAWGYVEEINYTFILIRTWDQRRLVVPVRYFVSKPYENWSIRNPSLIKPVEIALDFRVDVDALREHFAKVMEENENYDGEQEPKVLVIASDNKTMTVRFYTSAEDSSKAWDLHCEIREEMIRFVREEMGEGYLPVEREMQITGEGTPKD